MQAFFQTHKCSDVCKALGLKEERLSPGRENQMKDRGQEALAPGRLLQSANTPLTRIVAYEREAGIIADPLRFKKNKFRHSLHPLFWWQQ